MRGIARHWLLPVLLGAFYFSFLTSQALALRVVVDMLWDVGGSTIQDVYNLQPGSVIQVIMFDSSEASAPGSNPWDNFGDPVGVHTGDPLISYPFAPPDTDTPSSLDAYDPFAVPEGHFIAYTMTVGTQADDGFYDAIGQFVVDDRYDRLYVRVFGTDDIYEQGTWASYWGISDVYEAPGNLGALGYWEQYVDDVKADQQNYFHVIPEPGTLSLGAWGALGLWAGRRRRRARRRLKSASLQSPLDAVPYRRRHNK